ncbi:TonB-dependent receptor [Aurantiacibacter xanthus]|uniref:TonB-dependent receptor n=1 Tax=Aurantiacibacter xanthus TaxID=1784712 RepID=A0A3A1P5V1_9SPHN|nr:TonB-dependent receptor [Aurantiacibacter xanthus]RIV89510.1 TonB-dependent receptor [Aurantiacibacter xanthus]
MIDRSALSLVALAAGLAAAQPAAAQDSGNSASDHSDTQNITLDGKTTITVTSSRIKSGDPSVKVEVITEEEIRDRGVTSVEELIQTLPQNLATIGTITNERARGPLRDSSRTLAPVGELGSLGVSAANLGGLGAGNTLILVNGRRIAGAAGIEDGFVNLNTIPLSAVERVEITQAGATAIYGADAMGGVINFILKNSYSGTTLTAQHEFSDNDADNSRFSLYSRKGWSTGSISGTVSYSRRDPVNNYKSGYTTQNYSDYFGGDPAYDYRSFANGTQPGVYAMTSYRYDPDTGFIFPEEKGLSVPVGFTGRPTLDDLIELGPDARRDFVPELAGPTAESLAVTVDFEQEITNKLTLFATGLWNRNDNRQQRVLERGLSLVLAPGQAYSPFPAYYVSRFNPGTPVYYYPGYEIENGLVPAGNISNRSESWSVNAGFSYDFNDSTTLEFIYTRASDKSRGRSDNFGSLVSIIADPASSSGFSCYNFMLANGRYPESQQDYLQSVFDAQCAALTSTDPDIAVNPWSSSPATAGGPISPFFYRLDDETRASKITNYELRLTGDLFELPGGKIHYAVGGDYSDDGIDSREINLRTGASQSRDRYAFFGEVQLPLLGNGTELPLIKSLTLSAAARRDTYETEGAVGTVDGVPFDQGGEIIYAKNTFSRTTPSLGVAWEPFDSLLLRGHWTTGFRAPPYTQLFNITGGVTYPTSISDDPLYDCRENNDCDFNYSSTYFGYYVPMTTAPNPDLKPQTSDKITLSAQWRPRGALAGLDVSVSYNNTKIHNQYATRDQLGHLLPRADILQMEQFYPRNADGRIIAAQNLTYNILGSSFSSIVYELGYRFDTPIGTFEPRVTWLDNLKAELRTLPGKDPISTLGKLQGADDYRVVGQLGWSSGDVRATLWAYYTPSYENDYEITTFAGTVSNPDYSKQVDSLTTIDLTASWQMNDRIRLDVAGRDIFAARPPLAVVQGRPYDTARYNPAGRRVSVQLSLSF